MLRGCRILDDDDSGRRLVSVAEAGTSRRTAGDSTGRTVALRLAVVGATCHFPLGATSARLRYRVAC